MFQRLTLAAVAIAAIGTAQAGTDGFVKQSIDSTVAPQVDLAPDGSLLPSDLSLDTDFSGSGLNSVWPPEGEGGWSLTEDGLRVFPWIGEETLPGPPSVTLSMHKGYYLVGKQKNAAGDGWRAWVTRVNLAGTRDATFGTDGWIYGGTQDDIVDAVVAGDRLYVLSNIFSGTAAPPATRVACKNLTTATGSDCFPALAGVQTWGASAAGPRTAAYGQRLAYDSRYGLFVAARVMSNNRGQEVGVARISAANGTLVAEFKDDGYNIGLPNWAPATGAEVAVNVLTVTPAGNPGGVRVYVAGRVNRNATDHDGFILGLAPTNGILTSGWNWSDRSYFYERDNAAFSKDAITALAVLRNGKVAYAGWSESDDAGVRPMMMGRINNDGVYDSSFCAGNPNREAFACLVDPPFSSGAPYFADYRPYTWPVALAERRQNRDLVVAQRFQNSGGTPDAPDDNHVRTLIQQYGASGNRIHAARTIDIAGGGSNLWSRPFDLWMGGSGVQTADGGLGEEVIAVAGTRWWADVDFDATIGHLKATDSIFADPFGGPHGD